MTHPQVYILEKDTQAGEWLLNQLSQVNVPARWFPTVTPLLTESEAHAPVVCLISVRSPVAQVMAMITDLVQEPRFTHTAFILMGPLQHKHAAFEAGADDYVITPPDVIELRKRVRLHLDHANLEARLIAETSMAQEMQALSQQNDAEPEHTTGPMDTASITLLEHAAAQTQERNLFELILAYTGNAIALVAPDGTLLYTNPAWQRVFTPQPHGTPPAFGWPPITTSHQTTQAIANAVADMATWYGEARFVLNDKSYLDLAMTIAPAFSATRELVGFVISHNDLSECKAEQDLKTRFIATAAAELRNPVTNIKMRQYLLREAPPHQQSMHQHALASETDRLSNMIEAILEIARLDEGTLYMTREPVNLPRLAGEAITRYSPAAQEKSVNLTLRPSPPLPDINGDPLRLARAVGILIENAIQHTPADGHVTVRIEAGSGSGGAYQTIHVSDDGMGIPADDLPLIFDRFYRTDNTRSSGIRGVGLGLAIAQAIIHHHQGTITVQSQENQGSTFSIWLPKT